MTYASPKFSVAPGVRRINGNTTRGTQNLLALLRWFIGCSGVFLAASGFLIALTPLPVASKLTGSPDTAAAHTPLRVFVVLDDSWSMSYRNGSDTRMTYATEALARWAAALDLRSAQTIELITASDRLDVSATFALRTSADRTALIEAIRRSKPRHNTRTDFSAVDAGLAHLIQRDTAAGEDFALVFVTDAIADEPRSDLRAEDLGERTMRIGGGVYAVMLGPVPARNTLARRGTTARAPVDRSGADRSRKSETRQLRSNTLSLVADEAVVGIMPARLFGGWDPFRVDVKIDNEAGIARLVRFETRASAGLTASAVPSLISAPAGASTTVTINLSAPGITQGNLAIIAHLPDGRSAQRTMRVELVPGSWIETQIWGVSVIILGTLVFLVIVMRWKCGVVRVGDHADVDRQAALSIGDSVSLDTFTPGATGTLRRGWFGYQIATDGQPVAISGRRILVGKLGRYRLGEDVRIGERTFAIFRIDDDRITGPREDFSFASLNGQAGGLR